MWEIARWEGSCHRVSIIRIFLLMEKLTEYFYLILVSYTFSQLFIKAGNLIQAFRLVNIFENENHLKI